MRNRGNDFLRALTYAALVLTLQMAAMTPLVQAQQSDPLQNWLIVDCEVGQEGQARAGLAQLGAQAVPSLVAAAQNGPDATVVAALQASASNAYDNIQQLLAAGGGPDGLDPSDSAAVLAQSRPDFIAEDITRFVQSYRTRGVEGLGVVGGSAAIQALQQFANDSSSPNLQAVAQKALAGIFSAFSAKVELSGQNRSSFELNASFTLAANSDGIDPVAEPVTIQVGTFWTIVSPDSFVANRNGSFAFEGAINGVKLEARIRPLGENSFAFTAEGRDIDMSTHMNPVTVALTIGDNTGTTTTSTGEQDEREQEDRDRR